MFGIKIISEERYRSEQKSAQKMVELHDELVKKNVRLELDIKSLREQNSKLRVLNGKRKDENENLIEKNRKLKEQNKALLEAGFEVQMLENPTKCAVCKHETKHCKKITVGDKDICILVKPSFRAKK